MILNEYADEVEAKTQTVMTEIAQDTASELTQLSPKNTGEYSKGWTYTMQTNSLGTVKVRVYNSTKPTLTHILENGYVARNGRRIAGQKHISTVQKNIENEALKKLERGINEI